MSLSYYFASSKKKEKQKGLVACIVGCGCRLRLYCGLISAEHIEWIDRYCGCFSRSVFVSSTTVLCSLEFLFWIPVGLVWALFFAISAFTLCLPVLLYLYVSTPSFLLMINTTLPLASSMVAVVDIIVAHRANLYFYFIFWLSFNM